MPPTSSAIRLRGRDALDLLHRVTTNSLRDLASGEARGTLFCDFRGRLLHRAVVARIGDDVWLLREDAPAGPLLAHLDRQIFRDDVKVEDCSERLAVTIDTDAPVAEGAVIAEADEPRRVCAPYGPALAIGPQAPSDPDAAERERIAAGRPGPGHEITDEFHPFEVNLAHEVHLDKGCFTGQETLQRLVTYDSVRRRLARAGGPGRAPLAPAWVMRGGERAGRLTSAIADASGGSWTGLLVLAWDVAGPAGLTIDDATLGWVEALPLRRPLGREWAVTG